MSGDGQLGLPEALSPLHFAKAAGLTPDPWQAEVLRSHGQRILLNCSRQSGKSTVTSILAAHRAIFAPGSTILLLSRAQRQSQELFRKALDVWRAVGGPLSGPQTSTMTLELTNRSRIVALPGSEASIRSFSDVDLLLIDEAARVPDEVYYSMRPVLAVSGGRLVALSTPFGTRGWWWEAWRGKQPDYNPGWEPPRNGKDDWQRWRIPSEKCPRITPEFLEEERATLGKWWFEQEYGCEFLDAQTAAFSSQDIERAFAEHYDTWDLSSYVDGSDDV